MTIQTVSLNATIADGAVTTAKLNDSAVTTAKLNDSAVTSAKINDETIVNADISASAAIVLSKLANATLSQISDQTVSGAAVDSVSFTSLTGNTDEYYLLLSRVKNPTGSAPNYVLRPNGATTNMIYQQGLINGGSVSGGRSGAGDNGVILNVNANLDGFAFTFIAAKVVSSTLRRWVSLTSQDTSVICNIWACSWNETSTEITSLDVVSSVSGGIGVGSNFQLYKVSF